MVNADGAGQVAKSLGTVESHLEDAQKGIAAAQSAIEEAQRRAVGSGMAGVAGQLRRPQDSLRSAHDAASAAGGRVEKQKALAQTVGEQSTTDEVIGCLSPVMDGAGEVTGDLAQAKQHLTRAAASVNHVLGRSAGDIVSMINAVSSGHITKAWKQTSASKVAAEEAIEKARNLGKR